MATIAFRCDSCGQTLKVGADKAGKKVKCVKCQAVLTIPGKSEQVRPAAPARARPTPPPIAEDDDEHDDEPVRRPRKRRDDMDDDRPMSRRSRKNFTFDGTAGTFFVTALLAGLLNFVTLGIGFPWAFCMVQRWKAEHTCVEGRRLRFDGTGLGLLGNWLLWYLLLFITLGIYIFWLVPAFQRWIVENTEFGDE